MTSPRNQKQGPHEPGARTADARGAGEGAREPELRERISGRPTVVPEAPPFDDDDFDRMSQVPTLEPPEGETREGAPRVSIHAPADSFAALGFVDGHNRSVPPAPSMPPPSDSAFDRPTSSGIALEDLYAVGNFSGALVEAERRLQINPEDEVAMRYADECRRTLTNMYLARIGSLGRIVELRVPMDDIRWLSLDHRAGFILSLVDGFATVEEVLDMCAMPRLDALRILLELSDRDVVAFD